jgi:solute carrier family 45 protein 1/2/4
MTGFAALSVAEEGPSDHDDSSWTGVSRILGPRWARFPIITVSFLGAQLLWSVEMSYGENLLLRTVVGA